MTDNIGHIIGPRTESSNYLILIQITLDIGHIIGSKKYDRIIVMCLQFKLLLIWPY